MGCSSFLHVSFVAKIGYIPQFKASNARDQDEVSSDLARMEIKCICSLLGHACVNKNENSDPCILIRKGMGHTAVSAT